MRQRKKEFTEKLDYNISIFRGAVLYLAVILATLCYLYLMSKHLVQPGGLGRKFPWGWRTHEYLRIDKLKTYYILLTTASLISIALISVIVLKLHKKKSQLISTITLSLMTIIGYFLYLSVTLFAKYEYHIIPGTIVNRYLFGLFEDATRFKNIFDIISTYEQNNHLLVGHSVTHPQGNIIFIKIIIQMFERFASLREIMFAVSGSLQIDRVYLASVDAILRNDAYFAASTFLGLLLPLLSIVSLLPLYIIGKNLFNRRVGYLAALLSICIPAYILISPQIDQLYVLLAVTITALYVVGYRKNNVYMIILGGLVLTLSLFFTIAIILLLPILWVITVVIEAQSLKNNGYLDLLRLSLRNKYFIIFGLTTSFGFLTCILIEHDLLYTFFRILKHNSEFNKTAFAEGRPYLYWLVGNLYEYAMFLGIPLSVLFVAEVCSKPENKIIKASKLYSLLILFVIIMLDISGINRGEVARLWMFLMPFYVLAVASYIDRICVNSSVYFYSLIVTIIALQFFQSIAFRLYMPIYNVLVLVYT